MEGQGGYPLSSLCGHMSFLYPVGWVFLEGDTHLTWYHCLMHYSVVTVGISRQQQTLES